MMTNKKGECQMKYDYENKCDCSEDDNCGCSFPNNIYNDYSADCGSKSCDMDLSEEKVVIDTDETHIEKETVCLCSKDECECKIVRDEKTK